MQSVQEYLDSLSDDVKIIYLSDKNLTILPDLSRFTKLKILNCCSNQLISLPENLPDSLQELLKLLNRYLSISCLVYYHSNFSQIKLYI